MKSQASPRLNFPLKTLAFAHDSVARLSVWLGLLCLALTISAQAQSTNWLSGINGLNVTYGLITDTDVVDNATLIVTNGGNLTTGQLMVGPTNAATLILSNNASITVAQLLVTNNFFGVTNSTFNFSGGTLTTSNYNGLAASILIASNANYTINGNWTMNAGTNQITQPPGVTNANILTVNVAGSTGATIAVNTNAALLLGPNTATNNMILVLGNTGGLTNNMLIVNDGLVNNVSTITVGNALNANYNQMVITNGGQVYQNGTIATSWFLAIGNAGAGTIGNSLKVWGADSSGRKARLDLGSFSPTNQGRLEPGAASTSTNALLLVGPGGIVTNGSIYCYGVNGTGIVTNGGVMSLSTLCWGRTSAGSLGGLGNIFTVVGADSGGNLSTVSASGGLFVGASGGNAGGFSTNNSMWIMQNGVVTNVPYVMVGGGATIDTNDNGNYLVITNGGQLFAAVSATISCIGYSTNCNNNYIYVGGAFGSTNAQWNHAGNQLRIGGNGIGNTIATNNTLIVASQGVVTNISTLTVGWDSTSINNGVTVNGGSLYATNVIVTTNNYLTLTNNGMVSATVNVNGGTYGGSGTNIGVVSIAPQGKLAPGGLGTIGALTINSNLLLNGSASLLFDLTSPVTAGTTYDQIVIGGSLVFAGNSLLQLNVSTGWVTNGTYTLMTYPQGRQGQGAVVFPVTGTTNWGNLWLTNGPTSLVLGVTTTTQLSALATNLTWKGTGGNNGTWDSAADTATLNWSSNGVPQTYADGDFVRFDDTASFFTVTNNSGSAGYSPGNVIFANSASNYVMGAAINGAATVTLAGNKTVMFTGTNTYTGNTFISGGGNLIVTNGGSLYSPAGTLNVQFGTNTLAGGSITVKTLLANNNTLTATNSYINLNGGTLITSNLNGVAASIVLATNASFTLNSSWTMNAGTNTVISTWEAAGLITNTSGKSFNIGSAAANSGLVVTVNSNAVWSLGNQAYTTGTNNFALLLGSGTGSTNNLLLINGGIVTNVGGPLGNTGSALQVGSGNNAVGNQLIITNGGLLYSGNNDNAGTYSLVGSGSGANSNSIVIINPNLAGPKSIWNGGNTRLNIGSALSHYNSMRIDQGGWLTNINMVNISSEDATFIVTNGGVVAMPGFDWGRANSTNNTVIVAGADNNGNLATLNLLIGNLAVGGSTATASPNSLNNKLWIMQNGQVINVTGVYVGGAASADNNVVGSVLTITNGGQLSSTGGSYIGYTTNDYNNSVYLGGANGATNSLWNAGGQTLKIGGGAGVGNTFSSSNTLTVATGGVVTNITTLTLGNDITATNNVVTVGGGYLYAGAVVVNTNNYLTLTNNGTVAGTVNVNGGTYFVGTGTNNGAVNISPQGTLVLGGYATQGAIGTLTISSNLILNGGSPANGGNPLIYTLVNPSTAGTSYDQIVINGNLVVPGNSFLQLNVPTGVITNGSYTLMTYPQGRQGLGNIVFPVTGTTNWGSLQLANGPTSLVLTVTSDTQLSTTTNNLTWNGNVNGTWDSAADSATQNWRSNGVSQTYVNGDFVTFDDTASSFTVTNNTGSSGYLPGSVQFVNNANNYVLGAAINGTANVTLAGTKTVTFAGTNTYTGNTFLNGGVLQVGTNSGSGQIWTNISLAGGSLAYNLTNNSTQQGVIASGSGVSSITNNGTYATTTNTLKLADGFNLFNYIANNSGTLILNGSGNSTNYFAGSGSALIPFAGATIQLNGGNFIITNANQSVGAGSLIVNGGNIYDVYTNTAGVGAGMNGSAATNFTLNSGTVVVGGGGGFYMVSNNDAFNMNGGKLILLTNALRGFRFGGPGGSGSGPNVNFTGVQTGGTIAVSALVVAGGTSGFDMGGFTANVTDTYILSGGLLEITNGPISGNSFQMTATNSANGGLTMFTLTNSGQLLVNGNIANTVAATAVANGVNAVFAFDGGTLACNLFNVYALRSDVANGAFGVLTNNGGTLAPGWTNSAGQMTIVGSYVQNNNGTLDIDIDGAAPAGVFTNYPSPAGYDQLIVTNQTILNGTLVVRTNGSFSPTSLNSFTVLTNWNNAANNSLSVTLTNLYNNRVAVLGGLGYSVQVVTNANTLVLTNFAPLNANWNLNSPVAGSTSLDVTFTNFDKSAGAITNVMVTDNNGFIANFPVGTYGTLTNIGATQTYTTGTWYVTNTVFASDGTKASTYQTIVVTAGSLVWTGLGDTTTWDIGTTANWTGDSPTYLDGYTVAFDDTGVSDNNTNITLNTTVAPGAVYFTNTGSIYTLSGSGNITGSTSLIRDLAGGTVILATPNNDYTGGTYLNAGTLQLGTNNPLGTGLLKLTGGTLAANGSWTLTNAIDLAFPATLNASGGNLSLTGSFSVDVGALTNAGTGIVTLSGANATSYSGGTYLTGGELSIGGYTNLPTTGGLNFNGGTLQVTGTAITNLNPYTVNWSAFNGGLDVVSATNTLTVSNIIGGTNSLTKLGAGALTLTATNTFSGPVTNSAGTLAIGGGGSGYLGRGNYTNFINNNGGLVYNSTNNQVNAGFISGTGTVTVENTGQITLGPNLPIVVSTNVGNSFLLTVQGGTSGALAGVIVGQTLYYPNTGVVGINNTGYAQITNVNPGAGTIGINEFASNFNNTTTFVQGNSYSGGTTVGSGGTLVVYGNSQATNGGVVISGPTGTGNLTMQDGSSINDNDGNTSSSWFVPTVYFQGNVTNTGGARSHWGFGTLNLNNGTRTLALNGTKFITISNANTSLSPSTSWNEGTSFGQIETAFIAGGTGINSGWVVTNGILDLEARTAPNPTNYALFLWGQTPWFTNASLVIGSNVIVAAGANMGASVQLAINKGGIFHMGFGQNNSWNQTIASLADGVNGGGSVYGSLTNWGILGGPAQILTINDGANPNASTSFSGNIGNGNPYAGVLSLVKNSTSTQILAGTNTYTGNTTINAGTLALSGSGSIANSPLISVTNGAVFNVAGLTSTFTLLSSQTLSNSAASTGTLNGNLNTASSSVVSVTYDGTGNTSAFTVTNGTLTLNPATIFTIKNTGTQLGAGSSSKIVSKATTGNAGAVAFAATAPTVTVGGNGAAGAVSLVINNGELYVNVAGGAHTNAYLIGITLTPVITNNYTPFNSNTLSYVASEAYSTNFTVTVTNADATATNYLTYNGTGINFLTNAQASGLLSPNVNPAVTNVVQVTVTAQDGVTTKTYLVNVVELPDQTAKPVLTNSFNNGILTLNWPLKDLGYRLLVQTNSLANGISTNASDWWPLPNSAATNTTSITTTNVDDYYRLVYP